MKKLLVPSSLASGESGNNIMSMLDIKFHSLNRINHMKIKNSLTFKKKLVFIKRNMNPLPLQPWLILGQSEDKIEKNSSRTLWDM